MAATGSAQTRSWTRLSSDGSGERAAEDSNSKSHGSSMTLLTARMANIASDFCNEQNGGDMFSRIRRTCGQ